MDYTVKEFYIEADGKRIFTKLYRPDAEERLPLIVFVHGLGADNMNFANYAKTFAPLGYACVCFDFCGGGFNSKSTGKTTDMTPITEVTDLEAVLNEARSWDLVNTDKIVLVGESLGGIVSAMTAAKHKDAIAGLFLIFPAFVIRDNAHRFKTKDAIPETVEYPNWITLGRQYYLDSWDIDIDSIIEKYDKPVCIIHGKEDDLVPFEYSIKANEQYADSKLYLIDGVGHELNNPILSEPAMKRLKELMLRI